jgi:hypothetical protein
MHILVSLSMHAHVVSSFGSRSLCLCQVYGASCLHVYNVSFVHISVGGDVISICESCLCAIERLQARTLALRLNPFFSFVSPARAMKKPAAAMKKPAMKNKPAWSMKKPAAACPPPKTADERSEECRHKLRSGDVLVDHMIVECAHCRRLYDFAREKFECVECGGAVCLQCHGAALAESTVAIAAREREAAARDGSDRVTRAEPSIWRGYRAYV